MSDGEPGGCCAHVDAGAASGWRTPTARRAKADAFTEASAGGAATPEAVRTRYYGPPGSVPGGQEPRGRRDRTFPGDASRKEEEAGPSERLHRTAGWPMAPLRLAAALAGLAGLSLTVLNLLQPGAVWSTGTFVETLDPSLGPSRVANTIVWGGGFALLALAVVWRIANSTAILMAGLWLGLTSAIIQFQASVLANDATLLPMSIVAGLMNATGIRFTQLWPRPVGVTEVRALTERAWLRVTLRPVMKALLRPSLLFPAVAVAEAGAFNLFESRLPVLVVVSGAALVASSYLLAGFRTGDLEGRRKIFWILEGVVVFLAGNALLAALVAVDELGVVRMDVLFWSTWIDVVKGVAVVACFAMALFYTGAFDAGMVLRRSTVYGAAGGLFVVVFLTVETTLAELVPDALGLESRFGTIFAGVVAALTFRPVMDAVDRHVKGWTTPESDGPS